MAIIIGQHHWPASLAQTPGNMFIHVDDDEANKLDSNTGQHYWAAPLASTFQTSGPQHHWAATPARTTSGNHHWPTPLANNARQQNCLAPLAINPGEPLASNTGQHRCSALLASEY
jgi:hypothetical protein